MTMGDVGASEMPGAQKIATTPAAAEHPVTLVALEDIDKNPYQTRYVFKEDALEELAKSIKENGIVQPIVVRPSEQPGQYVLVLGERRLRAAKMAGLHTIPAIVRRVSLQQAAEMTVLENIQRQDLSPLEQAEAFRVLSQQFKLTQAQIAERIGVSRETVANYMRLLRLPEEVMNYMLEGRLTFSDARAILALDHEEHIRVVAKEAVTKHLKWDEIERRVRELNGLATQDATAGGPNARTARARWVDPNVRAAQMEVERHLGMRVIIKDKDGKGKVVIEYVSLDEYERIVQLLRGPSDFSPA
jgi:ParB family chromosome partitioning protein